MPGTYRRPYDETVRRLRLGDLKRVVRDRCGYELPDDDAGREYLAELVAFSELKNRFQRRRSLGAMDASS